MDKFCCDSFKKRTAQEGMDEEYLEDYLFRKEKENYLIFDGKFYSKINFCPFCGKNLFFYSVGDLVCLVVKIIDQETHRLFKPTSILKDDIAPDVINHDERIELIQAKIIKLYPDSLVLEFNYENKTYQLNVLPHELC